MQILARHAALLLWHALCGPELSMKSTASRCVIKSVEILGPRRMLGLAKLRRWCACTTSFSGTPKSWRKLRGRLEALLARPSWMSVLQRSGPVADMLSGCIRLGQ